MSYIEKNLLPGEQITYRTKKNFIIFFFPLFWTCVILLFFLHPNEMIKKIAFIPLAVVILYWINQILLYHFSEFAITNIRIMMREGFFNRHTNDTRLSAIANVIVDQSLIGQALNYGTVTINSYGGSSDPFKEIDSPLKFQNILQKELYEMQQTKKSSP